MVCEAGGSVQVCWFLDGLGRGWFVRVLCWCMRVCEGVLYMLGVGSR